MPLQDTFNRAFLVAVKRFSRDRPVWCVTMQYPGQNNELLVVKAEPTKSSETKKGNIKFSYDVMQQIGRGVGARPMNELEVRQFGSIPLDDLSSNPGEMRDLLDPDLQTWVIMEFQPGLKQLDKQVEKSRGSSNVTKICRILAALQNKKNLKRLGRIIAVDLFLGNRDRFNFRSVNRPIWNTGNIVFQKDENGDYWFVGLDPFDPTGSSAYLDQELLFSNRTRFKQGVEVTERQWRYHEQNGEEHPIVQGDAPELLSLLDKGDLKGKARWALEAIIKEITNAHPELDQWFFPPKEEHVDAVYKGIKEGREEIRQLCSLRLRNKGGRALCPDGLRNRMELLGW
jgi:hypothetical protein